MKLSIILATIGLLLLTGCNRRAEFLAQAKAGQPIVKAIEDFRKETGEYPSSLAVLVASHPQIKIAGWEYAATTNGASISFSLRFYMGKGGVEYEPPNWIGNDEGNRTVILMNK
jgi:type II secretory pathway pseudopilin PulG